MELVRSEPAYGYWPPPPPPPPVLMLPPPALVPVPVGRPVVPADGLAYDDYFYDPPVVPESRTRVYQKQTTTDLSDSQLRQLTSDWQKSGSGYKSYIVGADRSLTVVDTDDVIVFPSSQKQCKWRVLRQQLETTPQEKQTSTKTGRIYPADSTGYLARPTAGYVVPAAAPPVVYPAIPGRVPAGGYYYPPAPVPARPELVYDPYLSPPAAYGGYYM